MKRPMIADKWMRPETKKVSNNGRILVNKAGYIPTKNQIERMMYAGEQYQAWKERMYDFGHDEEVPDDYYDPTRELDYDLADASQALVDLESRKNDKYRDVTGTAGNSPDTGVAQGEDDNNTGNGEDGKKSPQKEDK